MGKLKAAPNKSLQLFNNEDDKISSVTSKVQEIKSQKDLQHVYVQQSVTILAFKDKLNSSTVPPDVLEPKLFLGFLSEDLPLFVGAIIGASLILVLCLVILILWKCCHRMTILNKKKEYWLKPRDKSFMRGKIPTVVQSNSVVFLGLKRTQPYSDSKEKLDDENSKGMQHSEELERKSYTEPQNTESPKMSHSHSKNVTSHEPRSLQEHLYPEVSIDQSCLIISEPLISLDSQSPLPARSNVAAINNINVPNVIIHHDSPASLHQSYYSGTYDQHSLYSCQSHQGSELDLNTCSLTWSNYSLRPSSTGDCYYDLFQKASFCKKRKNRMRSDIAAAIALNRSQSSQLNKDTDHLVENEVEVVLDERITL